MRERLVLSSLSVVILATAGLLAPPWALAAPATGVPETWLAPLPTASRGADASALATWWQRFNDPTLERLQDLARRASPDLASAHARLMQARAGQVAAGAALGPQVDASASGLRARPDLATPVLSSANAGLSASWVLDLTGGQRAARDAATARHDAAQAAWHEARVAVAVSVASLYVNLRTCEAQRVLDEAEARSRDSSARLTDQSAHAGLEAVATAWQAQAVAAQTRAALAARTLQCDQQVNALGVLTAEPEAALRAMLAAGHARLPVPAALGVPEVPALALAQRPDVHRAERQVQAAAADVQVQDAERLPRVTLTGSLGSAALRSQGVSLDGPVWSIGPLQVSLPLFDGGRRAAQSDAARAAWDEATTAYAAALRQAVRDVEEALLRLDTGQRRSAELQQALDGYGRAARAVEARLAAGLASALEAEDARRQLLTLQAAELAQRKDMVDAWVALYTALGGGWVPQP